MEWSGLSSGRRYSIRPGVKGMLKFFVNKL